MFNKFMEMGDLSHKQMYENFNMGTGFVVVVDQESRLDFINTLRNRVPFKEIGHVENGSGIGIPKYSVDFEGYY